MAENTCNHECSGCAQNCSQNTIQKKEPLPNTHIKKIIGVLSGKGGVGKSMVSSLLAVSLAKKGYKVGIMDADITGPSIPRMFDLKGEAYGDENGIFPLLSEKYQIKIVSVNMMLESEDTPVLWRGPIVSGMVDQFYTDVYWGDLDYLIIDMPPGTSDVALSVLQDLPVDGLVMVTSASKLISMVVSKAVVMAQKTNSNIIGLVENMSYVKCPECHAAIEIYKDSETAKMAAKYGLDVLGRIPLDIELSNLSDSGRIEDYDFDYIDDLLKKVETL